MYLSNLHCSGRQGSRNGAVIMIRAILFAVIVFLPEMIAVAAAPLRIVAIGASNTQGGRQCRRAIRHHRRHAQTY
jgi:hypothetical protein